MRAPSQWRDDTAVDGQAPARQPSSRQLPGGRSSSGQPLSGRVRGREVRTVLASSDLGSTIGEWGAVLLVLLRICQGIAVGGEWGGAALMALEHSDPRKRGFSASFVNAGAPTGAVLGTLMMGVFSALPHDQFLAWGWRVSFLLSFVLLIVGMFIRLRVHESPIFAEALAKEANEKETKAKLPLLRVLARSKALIFTMLAGAAGASLGYQLATLLGAGFTPGIVAGIYQGTAHSITPVAGYLAALAAVSIVFIFLTRESRHNDLTTVR